MFSVDWSNQTTLLLNLTNLGLGLVLVLSLIAVFLGFCSDWLAELRQMDRRRQRTEGRGVDHGRVLEESRITSA